MSTDEVAVPKSEKNWKERNNWLKMATSQPEVWTSGYNSGRIDAVNGLLRYVRHRDDCTIWNKDGCGCQCSCGLAGAMNLDRARSGR